MFIANDGIGFPFMFSALYLLQRSNNTGSAIAQCIYFVWRYHILFSIVIGITIGRIAKKLLEIAGSKNWIDKESFLVFAFALAIFVVDGVSILGLDDLLPCFTAGSVLAWESNVCCYFDLIGVNTVFLAMEVKNEVEKRENDMDAYVANHTKDNVVTFIVVSLVVVHIDKDDDEEEEHEEHHQHPHHRRRIEEEKKEIDKSGNYAKDEIF
ncbi:166_t:CDS:2 [Entrophospora sp. SA101]|nr:14027_t:CDS:2 [Entrophospora sp. SA101]CAJ0848491.1 6338_t:CDS:2 [Entrophospora sp. SA101]CAJ0890349.1 166_t:CDS:2 [Entrophospora sp. SA101]